MDKIPVPQIRDFEKKLLKYLKESHPEILKSIAEKKVIEDEKKLESTIQEYVNAYLSGTAADVRPQEKAS
ncbi:MAG: hypothetical protein KatS3mg129_2806 [Leptospiraceae bacterium]|nr:MAG: hypothetical protein KatS3mg129_2806 [Leptospiraceae bacterium]